MTPARPAIVDHELQTRDRRQHQQARTHYQNADPNSRAPIMLGPDTYVYQKSDPVGPQLFTRRNMLEVTKQAAQRPMPRKLIDDLLLEGELAIVFGGTGEGKTGFAVHCGNDIASGKSTTGLEIGAGPQPVLYFDFELSDTQHARRYSVEFRNGDGQTYFTDLFPFHENFYRVEMDSSAHVFDRVADWEQFMLREMDRVIVESKSKVIIIDNITYLAHETDKGKFALPLMQRLNEMKKERGLSILVLAHTPKRDDSRPMSLNDLAGSRILANFADSVFGIGKSVIDPRIRYLKQFKVRSGEMVYSADHVGVFQFEKTNNHLGFELIGHSHEKKHLTVQTDEAREKLIAEIQGLSDAGRSQREIARECQISASLVNRHLKRSRVSRNSEGRIEIDFIDPERRRQWESWQPNGAEHG